MCAMSTELNRDIVEALDDPAGRLAPSPSLACVKLFFLLFRDDYQYYT